MVEASSVQQEANLVQLTSLGQAVRMSLTAQASQAMFTDLMVNHYLELPLLSILQHQEFLHHSQVT